MSRDRENPDYPSIIQTILDSAGVSPYGPPVNEKSAPHRSSLRQQLVSLTPASFLPLPDQQDPADSLVSGRGNRHQRAAANACLAGLWLRHGFLEESHEISQQLDTPEGAFWHAIMHRLEGDYSNAKYWYRQVGSHPATSAIAKHLGSPWDANAWVDDCRKYATGSDPNQRATHEDMARIEWEELFHHCWLLTRR